MEDKTFELLTKTYSELTNRLDTMDSKFTNQLETMDSKFTNRFNDMDGKFDEMGKDIKGLKNDVIRVENKLDTNSKALFDGYQQTYEKLLDVEKKVDVLSEKVEKQDVEIKVIKGGKA